MSKYKIVDVLDGAKILAISEKQHYYDIKFTNSNDVAVEVHYFAICQYKDSGTIYLVSCDENMGVEGDTDFDSIEKAKECAENWAKKHIKWRNYET
jgi:hypothetical protein